MIATVRIAPVEQWCKRSLEAISDNPQLVESVGVPVLIDTQSVRLGKECDGREWVCINGVELELQYRNKVYPAGWKMWICEHLLEMD